eukprot:TRINITY_DN43116_c0_g1_i1.p1 TRINITY_DN43116_c0_g1~~TRINITY_DN43116_c0_g1_i1.p1  ORF type:complete len:349 (+),score=52.33 TRINITY_DN43116_c0_g1_i1:38-1048(+)
MSQVAMGASSRVAERKSLPDVQEVLENVCGCIPVLDIARLGLATTFMQEAMQKGRSKFLECRGFNTQWGLQKAHAVETALFNAFGPSSLKQWTPGPNDTASGNVIAPNETHSWIQISGGTDWNCFQGGYQCISEAAGIRPSWVSFNVRIATPHLSSAFLVLAAGQQLWGLVDPVVSFNYNGHEHSNPEHHGCFAIQTGSAQKGDSPHLCHMKPEFLPEKAYDVAISLDWERAEMSMFIDGRLQIHRQAFKAEQPVRYVAVFNWRSGARAAFSELTLGDSCPEPLIVPPAASRRHAFLPACCRRRQRDPVRWQSSAALHGALVVVMAILMQLVFRGA